MRTVDLDGGVIEIGSSRADLARFEVEPDGSTYHVDLSKHRYLVVAGSSTYLSRELAAQIAAHSLKALEEPSRFDEHQRTLEDEGVREIGLQAGDSGPIYDHPMSTARVPLDPHAIAALAFCAGGERNPSMGTYDGMAGAGASIEIGKFRDEVMAGFRGSVGASLGVSQLLSAPYVTFADAINGWFVSERFAMRVFEVPEGAVELVARAQAQQVYTGIDLIGWVGLGFRVGH